VICLIAFVAYAICLYFVTILGLGYAIHPLLGSRWPLVVFSIILRWIPFAIYIWIRHRPNNISRSRRGCAAALAVAAISFSYFLMCLTGDGLSHFAHDFLECTMDLWPSIVMLLTVTSRNSRFQNSLRNAPTPIA